MSQLAERPSVRPHEPAERAFPRWQVLAATLAYLAYAVFVTRPLAWNLDTHVFGSGGDDVWGMLAGLRETAERGFSPFEAGRWMDVAAPEGLAVSWAVNVISWPSTVILQALTHLFGPVAALGIFVLAGYVLNGVSGFLLARRLTRDAVAAFVAGFAIAFFPFAIVKGQIHEHYMHAWVIVLLIWRLLELTDRPGWRNGAWAGLAAVLAFSWTPYFALFGLVVYTAFLAVDAVRAVRVGDLRRRIAGQAVSGGILLAVFAFYAALASASPADGFLARSIAEAYTYSSRPLEFLLPDARNVLFGPFTRDYLFSHAHGSGYGEINGYLGLTLLAPAAVAVWLAIRGRLPSVDRWRIAALVTVAAAAVLMSAPPTAQVGPIRLYFPGWLLFQFTDSFRVLARIVVVIMVPVALLAAYGLAAFLRRRNLSGRGRMAVLVVVTAVVAVDLSAVPFVQSSVVPKPRVYEVLRSQPGDGLVAEYPLLPAAVPDYEPALFQGLHGRPVINGYHSGTDQEIRALALNRLDDPRIPRRLRLLGVRWVVVDERTSGRPDIPPVPPPAKGLTLLAREDGRALYRVDAPPAPSAVFVGVGFSSPEGNPLRPSHWTVSAGAALQVWGACEPCAGSLRFKAMSFAEPRRLEVRGPDGRRLAAVQVPAETQTDVSVPLRFDRSIRLELVATPGPRSVREVTGGADPRSLAILVAEPSLTLEKPR